MTRVGVEVLAGAVVLADAGIVAMVMMGWTLDWVRMGVLGLVFCMGNPWVFLAVPIPIPTETHTHTMGMGFSMGQNFCTHTQPIPIPMAGNPWVYIIYSMQY